MACRKGDVTAKDFDPETTVLRLIISLVPSNETQNVTLGEIRSLPVFRQRALIELLEGRVDGDALFFSRDLAIEGDTEVVLMLRNAVDSEVIDVLDDLTSVFGPLAGLARKAAVGALSVFSRLEEDMEILRTAMAAPPPRKGRVGS